VAGAVPAARKVARYSRTFTGRTPPGNRVPPPARYAREEAHVRGVGGDGVGGTLGADELGRERLEDLLRPLYLLVGFSMRRHFWDRGLGEGLFAADVYICGVRRPPRPLDSMVSLMTP
jgi:hypothetical protein